MSVPTPTSRPKLALEQLEKLLEPYLPKLKKTDHVVLVGIRAYYRDSMGVVGMNDVGIYDDALFWVSPTIYGAFNGNLDPSRLGWNPGVDKFMARLRDGVWRYVKWKHRGRYWAFGQGSHKVAVDRVKKDGTVNNTEVGCFGINVHNGGQHTTSSEGCVTLVRQQWDEFQQIGYAELDRYAQKDFPFIVGSRPDQS
jgi:hypothetical protein